MKLGRIRFSTKWSKSPRKPPRSFLSPAGAPRRRKHRWVLRWPLAERMLRGKESQRATSLEEVAAAAAVGGAVGGAL